MALAMVGEALISASVEILLDRITSAEFRDFFANRKLNVSLLDELKIKLLTLNAVLNDAEEKQITNSAVKAWLNELKDAVLDAEDLLDEINTDSLRCKVEGEFKTFTSQVRSLLSSPFNQFYRSMNSKLEAISRRLENFLKQIDSLGLKIVAGRVSYRKDTDRSVEYVVARDDDKKKLLSMLFSDEDENNNHIQVLTIWGMGGLGKTTLAQSLLNDDAVQNHFDLKAWAWVSDPFDVFKATKAIVESATSKTCDITNFDALRVELKNTFKDKKILLVLDDLWNMQYHDWDQLIAPFSCGKKGSKIIVTTRHHRIAEITRTFPIHELKILTDDNCWCILAKHAFGNQGYDKYPILAEIGRQIATKCKGLPLAAKTLGGLLRSNVDAEYWNGILNSNMWANNEVLAALCISYLHLPPHLKRCFAYCSIFPRQYLLDRKELILLWMAEGFLPQIHGEKAMESIGEDYFNELLSRSLIEKDKNEGKEQFQMHDLIYDLARLVSGKRSCYFEGGEVPLNVRHLTYPQREHDASKRFECLYELKFLRCFLPLYGYGSYPYCVSKKVTHDWLPKLTYLRTLSLFSYRNITELPDSISNLVLLRYLDLSYTSIKSLPDAAFRLYNLQTLKLSNCESLTELPEQIGDLLLLRYLDFSYTSINRLPEQIGNLVNLRHLDIRGTNLWEMPSQISKLQDLRVLTSFVVGRENGVTIRELRKFPYLQGTLSILRLQNVVDPKDAVQADLKKKEHIEELTLEWGSEPQDSQIEKDVLQNLQPSTNLKKLSIRYYSGTSFPKWLSDYSYSYVIVLCITDCNYCFSLPPFGQLPSLKELVIERMKMVKTVGEEFYYNNGGSLSFQPFPLLESIQFEEMSEWEEWLPFEGEGRKFPFPCLKRLSLSECPKLRGNLPNHLPSLTEVSISECNQLEAKSHDLHWNTSIEDINIKEAGEDLLSLLDNFSYRNLRIEIEKCDSLTSFPRIRLGANCLQSLTLFDIPNLIYFSAGGLPTSLQSLQIYNCENLEFLSPESFHKYISLECLTIYKSCHSLASLPLDGFSSLQFLYIEECPNMEAITTHGGTNALQLTTLAVGNCKKLRSLPEQIDLPALCWLFLNGLPELTSLPPRCLPSSLQTLEVEVGMLSSMSKHELGFLFQRLTSLFRLSITGFGEEDVVNTLLKECLLPTSLQYLSLRHLDDLKLLEGKGLQHLTSLTELAIWHCKSLESLPEDQLPSSLELLEIGSCPLLEARYQSRKGKHWSKIAHIPAIKINVEVII
ncbi:putative disease resistance RPP13-like protein 1 isoform X1 [Glycine soja]|uniref:putative disease resistance RPP13-like protein 1 isoform X1 n=1 Tax=Glycine soja TaxID=3848 RepID=UPI00103FE9C7|nr:putative disease resistance RPP13-like protein 1 isoform X1 [Glycine soja]